MGLDELMDKIKALITEADEPLLRFAIVGTDGHYIRVIGDAGPKGTAILLAAGLTKAQSDIERHARGN